MDNREPQTDESTDEARRKREAQEIQNALRGLRFGSLHVIVQDGVVVQIDRTEKRRLVKPKFNN
ncbi:MAG: YezD family protein [Pirellulaceae bacterium]|nr:YezD family protein [Pirellulaceae bacterium]